MEPPQPVKSVSKKNVTLTLTATMDCAWIFSVWTTMAAVAQVIASAQKVNPATSSPANAWKQCRRHLRELAHPVKRAAMTVAQQNLSAPRLVPDGTAFPPALTILNVPPVGSVVLEVPDPIAYRVSTNALTVY